MQSQVKTVNSLSSQTSHLLPRSDPGAIAPPPAALVTIQPEKEVSVSNYNPNTRVVSVSVQEGTSPPTPSHCRAETQDTEPQDLTPIQPENVSLSQQMSHSSPDTPGKKERNSRKQCPYCNKGAATKRLITTTEIFSPLRFP